MLTRKVFCLLDDTGWTGSGQAVPVNCCYSSSNEKQSSKGINEGSAGKPVKG